MKITQKFKRSIQERNFSKHSHPKTYDWAWKTKGFNRIATVNYLISISGGLNARYLEIGCASNALFDSVSSVYKTGVDPATGGTHRMTSDSFFANNQEIFDVIFIDGLHEYEQVHRDAINALKAVEVGGYIAFHDFLPSTWKEHHVPRISDAWTGDCWKLAVQLMESTGIEFVILDIDYGVGLMKKMSDDWSVPKVTEDLKTAEFDRFVAISDKLPIHSFIDGIKKVVSA
ncbi:class I SAM-dependent methyltransferase [Amylibacter sp.]|jgi:hypothetical protein|nr:class I SAM-dependent methyltransferase [Amylibacter sp.]